jgi:hypothetical protein
MNFMSPLKLMDYQTLLPCVAGIYCLACITLLACMVGRATRRCSLVDDRTSAFAPQRPRRCCQARRRAKRVTRASTTQSRFALMPHNSPQHPRPFATPAILKPGERRAPASSFRYINALASPTFIKEKQPTKTCSAVVSITILTHH